MTTDYEDLVDRNEIAHLLGVGPTAVSNYVARTSEKHAPFPEPAITRSLGRFRLWDIADVIEWHSKTFPSRAEVWDGDYMGDLQRFRRDFGEVN